MRRLMMMKKVFSISLMILLLVLPLPAVKKKNDVPLGFDIQGGFSEFATIHINPISADSIEYKQGMPFDLLGDDLVPSALNTEGRRIANWEMLTNQPGYTLSIVAEPMKHIDSAKHPGEPAYQTELDYRLTFKYSLSYLKSGVTEPITTSQITFFVCTNPDKDGNLDTRPRNPVAGNASISKNSLVGSNNGEIWFLLDAESASALRDDTMTAPGYYTATVKMELVTK